MSTATHRTLRIVDFHVLALGSMVSLLAVGLVSVITFVPGQQALIATAIFGILPPVFLVEPMVVVRMLPRMRNSDRACQYFVVNTAVVLLLACASGLLVFSILSGGRNNQQQTPRMPATVISDLIGTWRGKSESYDHRNYTWELHFLADRRFTLRLAGGNLKSPDVIAGTWIEREGDLTLYPEKPGTEIFPIPTKGNDELPGYPATLRRLEPGEIELFFQCCDFGGLDHRVIATRVEHPAPSDGAKPSH